MVIAYVPFLVLVIGLLVWALASNAIIKEIGQWLYVVGLMWTTYAAVGANVHVGRAMIAYVPIVICLVGLLVWIFVSHVVLKAAGRWAFIIGLLWTIYSTIGLVVKVG